MPAMYIAIKKSYMKKGVPKKRAEEIAARTYIAHSPNHSAAAKELHEDQDKENHEKGKK
jgi:hypothetical protein